MTACGEAQVVAPLRTLLNICPHCNKELSRRDKLVSHIKSKHPGKEIPYFSPKKEKEASNKPSEVEKPRFKCVFCDKVLSRMDKLDQHVQTIHLNPAKIQPLKEVETNLPVSKDNKDGKEGKKKKKSPTPCPYCEIVLSRHDSLKSHIHSKHKGSPLVDISGTSLGPAPAATSKGAKTPSKSPEDSLKQSPSKPKTSPKVNSLQIKKKPTNPTPCPYCDVILSRTDSLKPHIVAKHPGQKIPVKIVSSVICPESPEKKTVEVILTDESKHIEVLKQISTSKKKDATKKKAESPKKSVKKDKSGEVKKKKRSNPTPCPFCDLVLSRSDALKGHVISKHPGEKVPEKGLANAVHSAQKKKSVAKVDYKGEKKPSKPKKDQGAGKKNRAKPTPCPHCPFIASRTDNLKPHILSKHPGKQVPVFTPVRTKTKTEKSSKGADQKSAKVPKEKSVKVADKKSVKVADKKSAKAPKEKSFKADLPSSVDWSSVWKAGSPVFVKFNFNKHNRKRKRTDSTASLDLETLFSDDPVSTPSNRSMNTPMENGGTSKKMFKSQVSMRKLHKTDLPRTDDVRSPSLAASLASRLESLENSPKSPSLIELHRRSMDFGSPGSPHRIPTSPPKKKIQILHSVTYK